ncbi:N-acetylmuramoyl-L-alanine amidase [Chitinophaga costaii]|uniref:N-acetylmuramoyl-L-alanine amidase n=1 Tax=Chitinophaga costaii TaxID=1335309 RepID=A0A1C4G1Z7_9BACT|nr:N-acetylmuramoyl-L-alanine amidase [Chitinophaga costaii]PUZ19989.1 N-acetylmuramoyl-L-alanine amidase [Chitinophaga costaii]SCC61791.1 N-acetylmuramoyl-L-alanine amidase [Chitinophaga costaii]
MKHLSLLFCLALLAACARNPYATSNKEYKRQVKAFAQTLRAQPAPIPADSVPVGAWWAGTVNFNLRKPNFVVIHHTAQHACDKTLQTFTTVASQVSAHYVICKDGSIHHMLNDYLRAWHAGVGKWGNVSDINSSSIGIELDNSGEEPFTAPQLHGLLVLLDTLKHRYNIPVSNFIGHGDIAPGRKVDPSAYFPWDRLAANGFGQWYGDTSRVTVPENFNSLQALHLIGYDVKDSTAAVLAFKRHFIPQDSSRVLDDGEKKILYDVSGKY